MEVPRTNHPSPTPRPRTEAIRPLVLLHGLLSSPREFGLIALPLRGAGVPVHAVTIESFTDADRRTPRSWIEWVDAAAIAIRAAVPAGQPFVLGGLCTGSLIAAAVCARGEFDVESLVMLAPTFGFDGWGQPWTRHVRWLGYALGLTNRVSIAERPPYGIKDPKLSAWVRRDMELRASSAAGPSRLPLWAIRETERLQRHVSRRLARLPASTTFVHAREDDVCRLETVERVFRSIPGTSKQLVVLENSYHMVSLDNDRRQVARLLRDACHRGAGKRTVSQFLPVDEAA
jgi:carboxylesterase